MPLQKSHSAAFNFVPNPVIAAFSERRTRWRLFSFFPFLFQRGPGKFRPFPNTDKPPGKSLTPGPACAARGLSPGFVFGD